MNAIKLIEIAVLLRAPRTASFVMRGPKEDSELRRPHRFRPSVDHSDFRAVKCKSARQWVARNDPLTVQLDGHSILLSICR